MTMQKLSLIRLDPEAIISTFPATTRRIDIPATEGNVVLSPPQAGWEGFGFRIADVVPADPVPEGMQETGRTVELVDGVPVETLTLEPIPPAPWPELTQRQFWKVLALAGMYEDVIAAVDAMPLEDRIEATQATTYEHDHWLIEQFRPAFGLDDSQFRDLWFWGASL